MNKGLPVLLTMTILSGIALSSSIVSADDDSVVDEINITVPVSCTISGTGMNTHNATINNGIYTPDIGTTTLHAFCNDNNGFAIYAAGFTGDEVGGTNSNKLVGTSASGNAVIETGLATTVGNPDVSNWAMKLAITQDSGNTTGTNAFAIDAAPNVANGADATFSQYHTVPNEYVKVAHKDSNTDMTATTGGVKLTTTYAAYISKTQPADTYSGQVIYALVHPASHVAPGELDPNADNISEVEYMQQFAIVGDANRQAIIDSMVPEQQYSVQDVRDGKSYTIAKYRTGGDYTEYNMASYYVYYCGQGNCDSTIYDQLSSEWQDFVDSCNDSYDNWDNEVAYSLVTPIYDVWMTKNLDLDIDSTKTYTNEDTDIGYNITTGEYDTAAWTPIRSTYQATGTHIHEWCVGGVIDSEYGDCEKNDTPESYDPGNLYWNGTGSAFSDWVDYYSSCDLSTDTVVCDQGKNPVFVTTSSVGAQQYHLGNYYNWAAALATNDSSIHDGYGTPVPVEQSICPAGWTLPKIGNGEDTFFTLWAQYGFSSRSYSDANGNNHYDANEDALWTSPLYFSPFGYYDGTLDSVGFHGDFWSSVASGSDGADSANLSMDGSSNSRWGDGDRFLGYPIRCIARPVVTLIDLDGGPA